MEILHSWPAWLLALVGWILLFLPFDTILRIKLWRHKQLLGPSEKFHDQVAFVKSNRNEPGSHQLRKIWFLLIVRDTFFVGIVIIFAYLFKIGLK